MEDPTPIIVAVTKCYPVSFGPDNAVPLAAAIINLVWGGRTAVSMKSGG